MSFSFKQIFCAAAALLLCSCGATDELPGITVETRPKTDTALTASDEHIDLTSEEALSDESDDPSETSAVTIPADFSSDTDPKKETSSEAENTASKDQTKKENSGTPKTDTSSSVTSAVSVQTSQSLSAAPEQTTAPTSASTISTTELIPESTQTSAETTTSEIIPKSTQTTAETTATTTSAKSSSDTSNSQSTSQQIDKTQTSAAVDSQTSAAYETPAVQQEFTLTEPDLYLGSFAPQIFDTKPLSDAYHNGDTSGLTDLQKAVLDKAEDILDKVTSSGMSDYEKELAVHDYIITHCRYDSGSLAAIPKPSEHCDDPYGALVNGQAICTGYTTAFRLFMDMLGIPCKIIYGTNDEGEDHAWNVVTIEGDNYYVDVTWDDPVPDDVSARLSHHTYFNVPKDFMEIDHILPGGSPSTNSHTYTYAQQELLPYPIVDVSELGAAVNDAFSKSNGLVWFIPDDQTEWASKFGGNANKLDIKDTSLKKQVKSLLDPLDCYMTRIIRAETDSGTAYGVGFQIRK